jgi:hypothetical protein
MIQIHRKEMLQKKLNQNWTLKPETASDRFTSGPISLNFPTDIHTELLKAAVIEDPYFEKNELKMLWVGQENWVCTKEFTLEESFLKGRQFISITQADTYVRIFINEKEVGLCNNFFKAWRFEVSEFLQKGQNSLEKIENPRFTFSLSYSFLEQALSTIALSEDEVQEKILMQAIENAELTYNSTVQDKQKQKDDLLWQLQKNKGQEALYADLAEDMKTWYDKGIISTSEYKQALTNYTKASTQVRISEIDGIIYNIDIALLFY